MKVKPFIRVDVGGRFLRDGWPVWYLLGLCGSVYRRAGVYRFGVVFWD